MILKVDICKFKFYYTSILPFHLVRSLIKYILYPKKVKIANDPKSFQVETHPLMRKVVELYTVGFSVYIHSYEMRPVLSTGCPNG